VRELKRVFDFRKQKSIILDGDDIRKGLCSDLKFSETDRKENVRRVSEMALLLEKNNIISIVALISPYRAGRKYAKSMSGAFLEIYLETPLNICEQRDVKGLYNRARMNKISDFTGISSIYEPPQFPDIRLNTSELSIDECIKTILNKITYFNL